MGQEHTAVAARTQQELAEQLAHYIRKFFARRGGVLLLETATLKLCQLVAGELLQMAGGERALRGVIEVLRKETAGYTNRHFAAK